MCDLGRISGLLIAAKIAYIGVLITLGVAILNSASFFAAAANAGLMLAVIAVMAVVNVWILNARNELERCVGTTCSQELENMLGPLLWLQISLLAFTAGLIALAIVAAIPFGGAIAVGVFLTLFSSLTVIISAGMEGTFARDAQAFNTCRAMAGETTLHGAVIILAYIVVVVAVAFVLSVGGVFIANPPK